MNKYVIITDVTVDLPKEVVEENNLIVIPMDVTLDNETFSHTYDYQAISAEDFYTKLRQGSLAHTSQINPVTYADYFRQYIKDGYDILYMCFSSALSSTIQSANLARLEVLDEYPNREIMIIDTLAASSGEGLMVLTAARNKAEGMSFKDNIHWLEEHKLNFVHNFTVDDLMFLKRGGRLNAATAIIGTKLKIKPVLHVDNEGRLINISKAHGRKASIKALVDKFKETVINPDEATIIISHADCLKDAEFAIEKIKQECPVKEIIISHIGPVIGCHSGPGTMTIFYYGSVR